MRKHAILDDNIVVKISDISDSDYDALIKVHQLLIDIQDFQVQPQVGWILEGNKLIPPDPNQIPVPDSVTPRQIRQALIISGVSLSQIDDALNSLSEPVKSLARVEWEYSIAFQRNRPLVRQVALMLGWTDEQLDNLWKLAASL